MKKLILLLMLLVVPVFAQRGHGGYRGGPHFYGPRINIGIPYFGYDPYYYGYPYGYYVPPVVIAPRPTVADCKTVDVVVDGQHIAGRVCKTNKGTYEFQN